MAGNIVLYLCVRFVRFYIFFLKIKVLGIFVYVWKVWQFVMALLSSFYYFVLWCVWPVYVCVKTIYQLYNTDVWNLFIFCTLFFFFFKYYWLELLYTIIYLLLLQQLWVVNPQSSTCIFMMKTLHCCNLLSPQTKAFLLINKFNVKNMY